MTEEEKQALENEAAATYSGDASREWMRTIIEQVEAKLSPKHSKKGTICEVWDGDIRYLRRADGFGGWETASGKFDRYREIPIARDALLVVQRLHDLEPLRSDRRAAVAGAANAIMTLIDNAQEG